MTIPDARGTNSEQRPPIPKRTFMQRVRLGVASVFRLPSRCTVHFIYLVPADRTDRGRFSIQRTAQHLQAWYADQMGGVTFQYDVKTFFTGHNAEWYGATPNGNDPHWYFWNNVLGEAADLAGAGWYQPYDDWVIYIDAEGAGGGGSGGTYSGICVLPRKDLDSIMGNDPDWTQCRGIGGCGHEMGHSLGLDHPPPGTSDYHEGIMGVGYGIYARCRLTEADKTWLRGNPFFNLPRFRVNPPPGLCPFTPPKPPPQPVPPRP